MADFGGMRRGRGRNRRSRGRASDPGRGLLAVVLAILFVMTAACKSTAGGDADSSPPKDKAAATLAGGPESDTKPCGTPPCTRYVSRSETRTLNSTIAEHPIISTVVLHLAGTVLCGGLLCLLGETVSLVYVGRQAKTAADNHECLRVRILPDGHELRLVDVAPSNQAPYCKD